MCVCGGGGGGGVESHDCRVDCANEQNTITPNTKCWLIPRKKW